MSDIVERLRDLPVTSEYRWEDELRMEAADEIERLQEDIDASFGRGYQRGYSHGQSDALEEAAKVADGYADMRQRLFEDGDAASNAYRAAQAEAIAAAIRALKEAQ